MTIPRHNSQDIFTSTTRARTVILKSAVPISSIGATSCGDGSANMFRAYWILKVHSHWVTANVKAISLETTSDRKGPLALNEIKSHSRLKKRLCLRLDVNKSWGYIHTQQTRKRNGTAKIRFSSVTHTLIRYFAQCVWSLNVGSNIAFCGWQWVIHHVNVSLSVRRHVLRFKLYFRVEIETDYGLLIGNSSNLYPTTTFWSNCSSRHNFLVFGKQNIMSLQLYYHVAFSPRFGVLALKMVDKSRWVSGLSKNS